MKRSTRNNTIGGISMLALVALTIWINTPQHPSLTIGAFHRDLNVKLGLDLQGGSQLIYEANIQEGQVEDPDEALAGVRDVIERRVNAFGIAEPVVQTSEVGGSHRVIVELAGVHNIEDAIRQIGETPQLDFRKEVNSEMPENVTIEGQEALLEPMFEPTSLTGKHLQRAIVSFDPITAVPQVELEFNGEGSDLFAQLTRENIGKRLAIYLDGVPISAPVVNSEITNGRAVITGGFTLDEAKQLARRLNAGALPVPIELVGQQTVGPTLGKLSIDQSITAGLIGLLAVALWMIGYYRLPGFVSALALVIYALLFLGIIRLIPVTLTLAGIAGFILSIGMAVDANILIFERFRENIRAGKTIPFSFKDGFKEAWESIWASNVSGLITGIVLYAFGTSIVRGFAVTFSIGIFLSMFTAITVSRGLLNIVFAWPATHKPFLLGARSPK